MLRVAAEVRIARHLRGYVAPSMCSAYPWWVCWVDRGTRLLPNGRLVRLLAPATGPTREAAIEAARRAFCHLSQRDGGA